MTATYDAVEARYERNHPAPDAFSNWSGLSEQSDPKALYNAVTLMRCFISNAELLKLAEHLIVQIKWVDGHPHPDRVDCNNYRNEWVQLYNEVRDTLVTRQWQKRYRGKLLEILDFIPGVATTPPEGLCGNPSQP